MSTVVLYCWCHSDSASVLLYFTSLSRASASPPLTAAISHWKFLVIWCGYLKWLEMQMKFRCSVLMKVISSNNGIWISCVWCHHLSCFLVLDNSLCLLSPRESPGGGGGQVENVSSVSPACRKRRLIGAVCRNHRIKRLVPCRCLDGQLKIPTKCLWRWEPDRRSNYFFSPPVHRRAVTCITEILLIVTLNNQFNSTQLCLRHKLTPHPCALEAL